jgi:hypothetical protein
MLKGVSVGWPLQTIDWHTCFFQYPGQVRAFFSLHYVRVTKVLPVNGDYEFFDGC